MIARVHRADDVGRGSASDPVAFLLDASRALGASLDYESTLAQLPDLAVPRIADWCAVALLLDGDGPEWLAVRCADPALAGVAEGIQRAGPSLFFDPEIGLHLFGSGQSLLFPRIDDAVLDAHRIDPEARELIRRLGLRSAIIVPMRVGDRVIGALALAQAESGRSFAEPDLDLAADLAGRAAMAAENARLYRSEQRAHRMAERAAESLRRLHGVAAALGGALTPEEVARVIVVQAAEALGARRGLVVVEGADGATLEPIGALGAGDPAYLTTAPIPRDAAVPIAAAVREGRPLWFENCDDLTARFPAMRTLLGPEAPFGARCALPLVVEGRAIGGVAWGFDEERAFAEDERELALTLARECALALERARLYADARRAIRARDDFISVAAHEIRAPISAIRTLVHTDLWHWNDPATRDPERARHTLTEIDRLCQMLNRLLSHLLDASRIETGRFTILPTSFDLVQLLRRAVDRARANAPTHAFALQAPPALTVEADAVRLDQVVTNLLENAVKFSPAGSAVEVALDRDGSEVVLRVRDHGEGIAPEHRARVFEPYYQAPGHRGTGLGLGLHVSREIVAQHGGTIAVDCPTDGGSRFTVRLPLRPPRRSGSRGGFGAPAPRS